MNGLFQNANKMQEEKENYQIEITKDEINKLDVRSFSGKITVVEDPEAVDLCIGYIKRKKLVGFDTESRPSFKKNVKYPVSLIQLAIPGEVFLFRINKTGFHKSIISLFEDKSIIKAGVSIHDDLSRLQSMRKFNPAGFVELQSLSTDFGITSNSLRKLVAILLGFRISKAQQLSNWEAEVLSEGQLHYAATDAWVSLEIYNLLKRLSNEN